MNSHELARQLLAMPDLPVVGFKVGQGSNEQGDENLVAVIRGGNEPAYFKDNNWGMKENEIGLYFFQP